MRQVIRTGATATIGYFAERLSELDLDRADGLLGTFGLGPLGERRFGDCSQGERKRALIARALVARPRLLLLDEPGAGLDLPGRETLLASLDRLARDQPELAIVMTTHHLEELPASTTHALLLRDGRQVVAGPVAETLARGAAERVPRDPRHRLAPGRALGRDRGGGLTSLATFFIVFSPSSPCPDPPEVHVSAPTTEQPVALDPLDFLAIDALLDDEEKAIRDTVRQFVREQIVPEVGDWFEQGILPREVIQELAKLGLFGMHLDGYGLPGASAVAYGLTCLELEAGRLGDPQRRLGAGLPRDVRDLALGLGGAEGAVAAPDAHRRGDRLLRPDRAGCRLRPGHDADARATRRIRLDPQRRQDVDHERHDRRHRDRLGAHRGRRDPRLHRREGNARLLRPGDPQEDVAPRLGHVGARARRRARAGRQHAARARSRCKGPLSCLNEARFGIVFGAVGAARACFEAALEYSKTRIVFEKPISAYQLTQQKLAEMALEINRASLLALHIGRMKDAGTLRPEHVSLGKMGNVRGAIEVCRSARTILGGNGITLEYPVIRHMNNLESVLTYEGTHEVHTLVVGGALTGTPAFR